MSNPWISPMLKHESKEDPEISKEEAESENSYIELKCSYMEEKEENLKREAWEELNQKMTELSLSPAKQQMIKQEIIQKEAELLRNKSRSVTIFDYEYISIIGRGAFSEVRVVRHKPSGSILALKKITKIEMLKKTQTTRAPSEPNIVSLPKTDWIVDLKVSFQDEKHLYLVMEYLAGGDLMTTLIKRGKLSESEARFYIAETILAVESVHRFNYIHRDIKPCKILIDKTGHIKLSDFGRSEIDCNLARFEQEAKHRQLLDKQAECKRSWKPVHSKVCTPDYMAPEVFASKDYDQTVDWWSVGVILFEMVVGYQPFFAVDPSFCCQKILHWKHTFEIPIEANLSREVTDLIRKLITEPACRIGNKGAEEIKRHPFFSGVDWEGIRETEAPWVPKLASEYDSSYFDKFEEIKSFYHADIRKNKKMKDANFPVFVHKKEDEENLNLVSELKEIDTPKDSYRKMKKLSSEIYRHKTLKHYFLGFLITLEKARVNKLKITKAIIFNISKSEKLYFKNFIRYYNYSVRNKINQVLSVKNWCRSMYEKSFNSLKSYLRTRIDKKRKEQLAWETRGNDLIETGLTLWISYSLQQKERNEAQIRSLIIRDKKKAFFIARKFAKRWINSFRLRKELNKKNQNHFSNNYQEFSGKIYNATERKQPRRIASHGLFEKRAILFEENKNSKVETFNLDKKLNYKGEYNDIDIHQIILEKNVHVNEEKQDSGISQVNIEDRLQEIEDFFNQFYMEKEKLGELKTEVEQNPKNVYATRLFNEQKILISMYIPEIQKMQLEIKSLKALC